ncbi:MAG: GAF domain-containing protein, partial [Planctomycetaceae bacterium]|nr:GAF domain-containing protein [Planctomycetaceae bacterium]
MSNENSNARIDVRVAVIQLECHPCFQTGAANMLAEPFIENARKQCLQELAENDFPVEDLQTYCKETYLAWHRARIVSIVNWLKELEDDEFPDVIVFPEGAVPRQFLNCLYKKLNKKGRSPVIFAGTHGFENSLEAWSNYDDLKVKPTDLSQLLKENSETLSILPVLLPNGDVKLLPKKALSPFERTGIGVPEKEWPSINMPIRVPIKRLGGTKISILPFVCAEALQFVGVGGNAPFDLIVIASYDQSPSRFSALWEQMSLNQIPVVYCNDGAVGGSRIHIPMDARTENWLESGQRSGNLPSGDGIILAQIALRSNATNVGVSRVSLSKYILKTTSVVPENPDAYSYVIANRLLELREQISAKRLEGHPIDTQGLAAELNELVQSKDATPLQTLQISRLLSLARNGKTPEREWNVFADACLIRQTEYNHAPPLMQKFDIARKELVAPRDTGFSKYPPTLPQLESDAATHCHRRISVILDSLNDTSLSAVLQVRSRLAKRIFTRLPGAPTAAVRQLFDGISAEATNHANISLTNQLGALVECFQATSGMLFVVQSESSGGASLVARIMVNTPVREIHRPASDQGGIVGHVASSRSPYVNSWVSNDALNSDPLFDPFYRQTIRSTRGEICVPLFAPDAVGNDELVAVVNLESRIAGAFSAIQVPLLQAAASQMIPDIRVLQAALCKGTSLIAHPKLHGWGAKSILDRVCFEIATSYTGSDLSPSISATVWYADMDKERFYVRGTSRYDFEFVADAYIDNDSFIGRSFHDLGEGDCARGGIDDLPAFRRRRKAARMELERAIVAPLFVGKNSSGSPLTSQGCAKPEKDGVLSLYSFKHEEPQGEVDFNTVFSDERIRRLTVMIRSAMQDFFEVRRRVALAALFRCLKMTYLSPQMQADHLRDIFQDVFEAQACTLFEKHTDVLSVISTSGIEEGNGKFNVAEKCDANWRKDFSLHHSDDAPLSGLTRFLAEHPTSVLRKVDVPDQREVCVDIRDPKLRFCIVPENRVREKGAISPSAHRGFLGASAGSNEQVYGVIRVIRSQQCKPFVKSDEVLISEMASYCSGFFRTFREDRDLGFSIQALDRWLQELNDYVCANLPEMKLLLTSIRYAVRDDRRDWQLRLLSYHTAGSKFLLNENDTFPQRRGNVGWKTIDFNDGRSYPDQ